MTKNASEITLTDDNFVTILHAVKEGRTIFGNIQKFTLHLLSGNVSEVIVLIIGLALRDMNDKAILPMVKLFWVYSWSKHFKFQELTHNGWITVLDSNPLAQHGDLFPYCSGSRYGKSRGRDYECSSSEQSHDFVH